MENVIRLSWKDGAPLSIYIEGNNCRSYFDDVEIERVNDYFVYTATNRLAYDEEINGAFDCYTVHLFDVENENQIIGFEVQRKQDQRALRLMLVENIFASTVNQI